MKTHRWIDHLVENGARTLARRTSRRSVLARLGAAIVGTAAFPLLPVARGAEGDAVRSGVLVRSERVRGEPPRAERFRLEVRLMTEPCLWCWEIHDTRNGQVVGSSWNGDWMAYDSSREAVLAANRRLNAMKRADDGTWHR